MLYVTLLAHLIVKLALVIQFVHLVLHLIIFKMVCVSKAVTLDISLT